MSDPVISGSSSSALAVVDTTSLSASVTRDIVSKTGKKTGTMIQFTDKSASEWRKFYREQGFKGRDLTEKVNETVTGGADSRRVMGLAVMQDLSNKGYLFDSAAARKGGASIKLFKAVEPKVKAATVIKDATRLGRADQEKLLAELKKALGVDEAAIDIAADAATETVAAE